MLCFHTNLLENMKFTMYVSLLTFHFLLTEPELWFHHRCCVFALLQNVALVYLKLGYPRLSPREQADMLPALVAAMDQKSPQHNETYAAE